MMPTRNRWGQTFTKGTPVVWHGARGGGPYHGQYIKLVPRDGFSSAYGRQALVWTAVGKIPARVSADHPDVDEIGLDDLKVAGLRASRGAAGKGRRAATSHAVPADTKLARAHKRRRFELRRRGDAYVCTYFGGSRKARLMRVRTSMKGPTDAYVACAESMGYVPFDSSTPYVYAASSAPEVLWAVDRLRKQ